MLMILCYTKFQSTLPRGERPFSLVFTVLFLYFNPRSREGSDAKKHSELTTDGQFQSTLPRGERRSQRSDQSSSRRFQSTLPRGERRQTPITIFTLPDISIHAPARGATTRHMSSLTIVSDFNPRSREGSDLKALIDGIAIPISIHAPARGATIRACLVFFLQCISIHAPARGATSYGSRNSCLKFQFQSTLPRGERLSNYLDCLGSNPNFNPRSREGSDMKKRVMEPYTTFISIHAPARGAT